MCSCRTFKSCQNETLILKWEWNGRGFSAFFSSLENFVAHDVVIHTGAPNLVENIDETVLLPWR